MIVYRKEERSEVKWRNEGSSEERTIDERKIKEKRRERRGTGGRSVLKIDCGIWMQHWSHSERTHQNQRITIATQQSAQLGRSTQRKLSEQNKTKQTELKRGRESDWSAYVRTLCSGSRKSLECLCLTRSLCEHIESILGSQPSPGEKEWLCADGEYPW